MIVRVFQRHERHCGRVEKSILAHHDRGLYFHPNAGGLGLLGSGYPLAAFLSSLDVHRHHPSEFSADPLGIFHRGISCGILGLHKHFRDHVSL